MLQTKEAAVIATAKVNDIEVDIGPRENAIQVARKAGVEIPHYCWHEALSVVASCRMCLIEVGETKPDGTIAMGGKLVPACQTPVKHGMVIKTETAKVVTAQAMTLEFLLLNHPLDCSICDQAGECYLQDYTFKFGKAKSRLNEPKIQRIDKYHIGEQIALFTDRCVMCTRCVRFTREISGTAELQVVARGSVEEIDVFPGMPCNNKLAGNVVDLCPVGALCSKDFLYKKRVWWLKSQKSVCPGCSTGCSIEVDQNDNQVYRLRPRANPLAQGHFMCDEGRFGFRYIQDARRLRTPILKTSSTQSPTAESKMNGQQVVSLNGNGQAHSETAKNGVSDLAVIDPWPTVIAAARDKIRSAIKINPSDFAAVLSPMMSVEEAYLLAAYLKGLDARVRLLLGPIPTFGVDDRYPKSASGSAPPSDKAKFTIRAEKCPNRMGVEMILRHFQGASVPFEQATAGSTDIKAWYFVGGYSQGWVTEKIAKAVSHPTLLIVQDIFPSPLSMHADIVLASAAFTEREGSYVNYAGLAQAFQVATRPIGDARADGRILYELTERRGLFNAAVVRKEISEVIPAFRRFASGDLGLNGVRLIDPKETYS
ncbi:MAG: molybdopterin-dependent oxidoreductase [Pirellulaceae bacterium]|nr:molybdopterin-dependent oxidoreductase [Pirellulaceae bacterium]